MGNDLTIFESEEFGRVRVIDRDGNPWFVAADVCRALDIGNSRQALARLDDDEKGVFLNDTPGGEQKMSFVNEPGLYSLVVGSRKQEAKRFKRWITHEVLPSIRNHGAYATDATIDRIIADPDFGIRLLTDLKKERDMRIAAETRNEKLVAENEHLSVVNSAQQAEIDVLKPKADYYDIIMSSPNTMYVSQIAADYGMSAVRFNRILSGLKIQYRCGTQWLLYQVYKDKGYTRTESYIYHSGFHQACSQTTKWTQKGRLFLYDILKKNGIIPECERIDEGA